MNKTTPPKSVSPLPFQTPGEETANSILHGIGALLAAGGLVLLVLKAGAVHGQAYLGGAVKDSGGFTFAAYIIFASAMTGMFLASTLYHAIRHQGAKRVFRVLDHAAIYAFIAGTYTPVCLLGLKGAWGWAIFSLEWALGITGIVLYAAGCRWVKKAELLIHLIMGWVIAIGWFPLIRGTPMISIILLLSGGAAYSLGTIWYSMKNRRGAHVIWHVFVLAGAVCHWWAVWFLS
ncbi:MAG: hemolysin III family protein [Treponema sp.]|jgi:hemolysin III|nr:hemolysin III family protein [Treponema sp.]